MGSPTVTPLHEQWHAAGFLVSEANGHYSRDQVTLTGGVVVLAGTVLGVQTATGFYAPLNLTATDGSQTPAAIAYGQHDVTAANKQVTVVSRACEVNGSELIWPTGITPTQITTATAALQAIGIIAR